jgi:radical SAM-linked protein
VLQKYSYEIIFTRTAPLKYLSHLDMIRLFERIFRLAGLPLAYSEGFNPRPRFSLAVPMAVGMTSADEHLEVILTKIISVPEIIKKLKDQLPEQGIEIKTLELSKNKGLKVSRLKYDVVLKSCTSSYVEITKKVEEFSRAETVLIIKTNKRGSREIDIRPRVFSLELGASAEYPDVLFKMEIAATSEAYTKPDDVLNALSIEHEYVQVHREKIIFDK